jgi:RNA polymerase sigma-70 factor (ECF subfamily)
MPALVRAQPERLLSLARAGDGPALGQLLELYRAYLGLLARTQISRRLQGKVDASDLVQEVFLRAHQHFPEFRGKSEGELLAWLRQILATSLANLVRRRYTTRRRDAGLERRLTEELHRSSQNLNQGLAAKQSSPSHVAERREQALQLADALERLPIAYREVLILRHLEGLTFAEVAHRLNRSQGSVQKLWVRGLQRLRGVLGETQ